FVFLAVYVVNHIYATTQGTTVAALSYTDAVFGSGMLFVGTFVYHCGLLIVSSKYYLREIDGHYWSLQAVTVLSGIAALYIGSVYELGMLRGISGTFFCLYVLEKYFEIPWKNVGWAWAL